MAIFNLYTRKYLQTIINTAIVTISANEKSHHPSACTTVKEIYSKSTTRESHVADLLYIFFVRDRRTRTAVARLTLRLLGFLVTIVRNTVARKRYVVEAFKANPSSLMSLEDDSP